MMVERQLKSLSGTFHIQKNEAEKEILNMVCFSASFFQLFSTRLIIFT